MKVFRKAAAAALAAVMTAAVLVGCNEQPATSSAPDSSKVFNVGICQYADHAALNKASEGFKKALSDKLGNRITFTETNAAADTSACITACGAFVEKKADLIFADGTIPAFPLELYDLLLDLGGLPFAALPPEDLRSTRNENSGMNGVRRYLGQAAAYRLAWKYDPKLLERFASVSNGSLVIPVSPEDLRKPCLEHLMRFAEHGEPNAEKVFRTIGENLSVVTREMKWLFGELPPRRFLFGRFVKSRRCFELLREGFEKGCTDVELIVADEDLANSPLMKQLSRKPNVSLAQFAQAIGAIYFAQSI